LHLSGPHLACPFLCPSEFSFGCLLSYQPAIWQAPLFESFGFFSFLFHFSALGLHKLKGFGVFFLATLSRSAPFSFPPLPHPRSYSNNRKVFFFFCLFLFFVFLWCTYLIGLLFIVPKKGFFSCPFQFLPCCICVPRWYDLGTFWLKHPPDLAKCFTVRFTPRATIPNVPPFSVEAHSS